MSVTRSADLRYVGQGHEVNVPVPEGELGDATVESLQGSFEEVYRRLYERTATGNPVEAMSWRVIVSAPRPELPLEHLAQGLDLAADATAAIKGEREIYLPEDRAMVSVPVYDRYLLAPYATFEGPAVIEERESTLIIGRGGSVSVDPLLNVVVTIEREEAGDAGQ
jgi:N-methylhydantoinase A